MSLTSSILLCKTNIKIILKIPPVLKLVIANPSSLSSATFSAFSSSISGTGNITLKKNGANWLILSAIDGSITVDSESKSVYKNSNEFEKMNATLSPLFPLLDEGPNVITWAETGFTVNITPRWEAIA